MLRAPAPAGSIPGRAPHHPLCCWRDFTRLAALPACRFTPLVIRTACFVLAAAWGGVTGGAYYALHHGNKLEATPGLNATLLGAAVYVIAQFILAFLGGILLSVLDAGGCGCSAPGSVRAREAVAVGLAWG